MTPRTTFPEVATTATKTGLCPVCGKRATRRQRFWQTESPFNRNPDGTVRTRTDIQEEVRAEAANWVPDFTHGKCS